MNEADALANDEKYAEAGDAYRRALAHMDQAMAWKPDPGLAEVKELAVKRLARAEFMLALAQHAAAPEFDLPRFTEGRLTLADVNGKTALFVFVCASCPACRQSLDRLEAVQKKFADKPFTVALISVNKVQGWNRVSPDVVHQLTERSYPFPAAFADEAMYRAYGACPTVPTFIVVDRDGQLNRQFEGSGWTWQAIEQAIMDVLEGKQTPPAE